jgi:hypothetical protein
LPARLILEIEIAKLLPAAVLDDKAGVQFLDSPGRRDGGASPRLDGAEKVIPHILIERH